MNQHVKEFISRRSHKHHSLLKFFYLKREYGGYGKEDYKDRADAVHEQIRIDDARYQEGEE